MDTYINFPLGENSIPFDGKRASPLLMIKIVPNVNSPVSLLKLYMLTFFNPSLVELADIANFFPSGENFMTPKFSISSSAIISVGVVFIPVSSILKRLNIFFGDELS